MAGCVLAVSTLAACGGGSGDSLKTVVDASRNTLSLGGIWNLTLDDARAFGTRDATIVGRGAFTSHPEIAYLAIQPSRSGRTVGDKSYLVLLPGRVYLKPAAAALPPGKHWLVADASGRRSAETARFVVQAEGLDPQLLLHEILWGATAASREGDVVVRHAPLAKYSVTIDLDRAARAAARRSPAERVAIDAERAALPSAKKLVRATVLVDPSGRVARAEVAVPGSGYGTSSMHFAGYGLKLPTSLPPASQTADVSSRRSPWAP